MLMQCQPFIPFRGRPTQAYGGKNREGSSDPYCFAAMSLKHFSVLQCLHFIGLKCDIKQTRNDKAERKGTFLTYAGVTVPLHSKKVP